MKSINMAKEVRRSKLNSYFKEASLLKPIILFLAGFFLLSTNVWVGLVAILGGGIWLYSEIKPTFDAPDDKTVDAWLKEDLQFLKNRSLERLNIAESELIQESLFIKGPIVDEKKTMVASQEVKRKKGKDGRLRFSAYYITVIHLTEHKLSSYQCEYNFIRKVPVRENDDEYFYKDVVSVSTKDIVIDNIQLSENQILRSAQVFLLIVPGSKVQVVVNYPELKEYTGGSIVDTSHVDYAVKAIRRVLLEKKM